MSRPVDPSRRALLLGVLGAAALTCPFALAAAAQVGIPLAELGLQPRLALLPLLLGESGRLRDHDPVAGDDLAGQDHRRQGALVARPG